MGSNTLQTMVASFVATATASPLAPGRAASSSELPAGVAQQLADAAFAQSRWQEAWGHYLGALMSGEAVVDVGRCLLFGARCALYLGEHDSAIKLLTNYAEGFPGDAEGWFYLGRAYQAAHRDFDALTVFNAATLLSPAKPKYLAALAQAAHSLAFGGFGYAADSSQGTYVGIAKAALSGALAKDPEHLESLSETMLLALDTGEIDKALATAKAIADKEDKHGRDKVRGAITTLALALARGGLEPQILRIAYLRTYPAGRRILARAKALRPAVASGEPAKAGEIKVLAPDRGIGGWRIEMTGDKFAWLGRRAEVMTPADTVSLEIDVVSPIRPAARAQLKALTARLATLPAEFAGLAEISPAAPIGDRSAANVRALLVRKRYWNEIVALAPGADWNEITQLALQRLHLYRVPGKTVPAGGVAIESGLPEARRQRVVVLSRHGPRLVGGGEQFLRIAADIYAREHGAEVFFAGLSKDWQEAQSGWPSGGEAADSGFVYDDPEAFRSFCLSNGVDAVHVISGLGEFVLEACRGLNVRLIYGVHFWREFIAARVLSRPYYPNVTLADAKPLGSMQKLLERADFAYVNSDFCADIARQAYSWSPPVIYSVPLEDGPNSAVARQSWEGYVLLVNARADKGWYLLLDIAARLPQHAFVAIASQSDIEAAVADVSRRGLRNVQVLDRTDRMDELYAGAALAVVPSFTFVETFSRVVVEAGRLHRPVLMADSGNLSYLGAGTDLVLPNDAAAWAERIEQLARDPRSYRAAVAQSVAIAERHSGGNLLASLRRVPLGAGPRILVCAGSGIGNICHTTPMIERLHAHYGVPIDVLVAGDFAESSAVMAGAAAVGQVFEAYAHVAQRPYDLVIVSHSFGSVVPSFNTPRLLVSRDAGIFDPAGDVHEAEFNLALLKAELGIDYGEADTRAYFFGALQIDREDRGSRGKIGLHAGSKGGIWASKRWPGFVQLAGRLIANGFEVISVGIAEEYVDGTIDKTELSIARMAEELSTCDAVVSNDSGVMNIANALGLPIVALFGPTNPVTRGPRRSSVRILTPGTDCAPCEAQDRYKARFTDGKCQCIALIGVDRVLAALDELGVSSPALAATA